MTRPYPDEPIGPFDPPPRSFTDAEERSIHVHALASDDADTADGLAHAPRHLDGVSPRERLVGMYQAFDPADRAQGIPPGGDDRIRSWLDTLLASDSHNVVAFHDNRAVGHATLVAADEAHELAIFVLDAYQGAGIGTELLTALLAVGAAAGVERVWLSVERWNRPAIGLYEKIGFEPSDTGSFELEMAAELAAPE